MAFFVSTTGKGVPCYNGTFCSDTVKAELTDEVFIAKARRNPDFTEVFAEAPVEPVAEPLPMREVVKPVKKPRKKRVSKK